MGVVLVDTDFHAIILGSLPELYCPLLSSISAAAKITKSPLTPNKLISMITEEFEHRLLTERRPSKRGKDVALSATKTGQERSRTAGTSSQKTQEVHCVNCDRKGHYKADCWRAGGGKEGQGPNQRRNRNNRLSKQAANAATEPGNTENYAFATSDLASVAEGLNLPTERRGAIMDSGATAHFCPDRSKFANFVAIAPQDVQTADGSKVSAIGRGDVKLDLPLGDKRTTSLCETPSMPPRWRLPSSLPTGSQLPVWPCTSKDRSAKCCPQDPNGR